MGGIRISTAEVTSAVNQVNGEIERQLSILYRTLKAATGFAAEDGLSGTTYDNMKNYYSDCYVPTIQAMFIFLTEWKNVNNQFQGIVSGLVDGQIDVENLWEVVYGLRQNLAYFHTLGFSAEVSVGLQYFLAEQEERLQELEEEIRKAEDCSQITAGLYGSLNGSRGRVEQGLSYLEGSNWDAGKGTYSYQHPSRAWREEVASRWKPCNDAKTLEEIERYWQEKKGSEEKWWQDEGKLLEAIRMLAAECELKGLSYLDIARLYDQDGARNPRLMALEELTGSNVDGIYLGDNLDALKAILLSQGVAFNDNDVKLNKKVVGALLDWYGTSSEMGRKILHGLDNGWGDVIGGAGIIAGGFAAKQMEQTSVWKEGASGAGKWKNPDGSVKWPPNNGAVPGTEKVITMKPGEKFGRIGSPDGKYTAPPGTTPEKLSLAPGTDTSAYTEYVVIKEIPNVNRAKVAPWFDQPGGGIQDFMPQTIRQLERDGFIKKLK